MAESIETSSKVACRSRRAVEQIISTVCSEIKKTLSKNPERIDEHCVRYLQKFRETFTAILSENILVNGELQDQASLNTTTEFDPVDEEKEKKINDELLPQLDLCIVDIARKRKQLPSVCKKAVTDYVNHQAVYLTKVKPQVQDDSLGSVINEIKQATSLITCEHLKATSATLALLVKASSEEYEKMVHLSKAVEIEEINRNCKTNPSVLRDFPFSNINNSLHSPAKRRCTDSLSLPQTVLIKYKQHAEATLRMDFVVQPTDTLD